MNVPLSRPDISDLEIDYVTRVLRSGQLSLGPRVPEFEEKFAAFVGARHAIAVNSGTSALHLAVRALGIGPGDEILTTSFSFVASANCALFEGALPVFLDIDRVTLNLDPCELRLFLRNSCVFDSITGVVTDVRTARRVRAILPVHVFGLACDMDPILELAREYNLRVIEDACEALAATYRGHSVGAFGDFGVFAFYGNKQMTTGEGGMVVTNSGELASLCRSLRNQGRDAQSDWLRHVRLGYNYRLSDIHAALGLAQLERIKYLLDKRARVALLYQNLLAGHPMLCLPATPPERSRSWFVFPIQLRATADLPNPQLRDLVLAELRKRGVACQSYFPAIHRQPYFLNGEFGPQCHLPRTEEASDNCLVLPFFSTMTADQVHYVCDNLLEILLFTTARTSLHYTVAD